MSCQKDHADRLPKSAISALHDSQAGFWRHKCAGCAYEMGRKDAGDAEERLRKRVQELTDQVDKLKAQWWANRRRRLNVCLTFCGVWLGYVR